MQILKDTEFKPYLKYIYLSEDRFYKMLNNEEGEKKRFFAYTFRYYSPAFLENVTKGLELENLKEVEYLIKKDEKGNYQLQNVIDLFDFDLNNMKRWKSKKTLILFDFWKYTPLCLVYHNHAHLLQMDIMEQLFPKPKRFTPYYPVCSKCIHRNSCKGFKSLLSSL